MTTFCILLTASAQACDQVLLSYLRATDTGRLRNIRAKTQSRVPKTRVFLGKDGPSHSRTLPYPLKANGDSTTAPVTRTIRETIETEKVPKVSNHAVADYAYSCRLEGSGPAGHFTGLCIHTDRFAFLDKERDSDFETGFKLRHLCGAASGRIAAQARLR